MADARTDITSIRLVATDMDGTLLDGDGNPPADFPDWVLTHPGIRTVIASGRQVYTLQEQFAAVADRLTFIADNGALVMEGDEVLDVTAMDPDAVLTCADIFANYEGCTAVLCGVKSAWVLASAGPLARENLERYYARRTYVPSLTQAVAEDRIVKIAMFFDTAAPAGEPWVPLLPAGYKSVASSAHWVDIANQQVNKGAAIRAIQRLHGISPDECMAFGDYLNDLELLQACTESYAMANAVEGVKAVAKHQTAANTDDGVMRVLRTL